MGTNNDLQSLKSNPIFQLSLASKELFHSNFLYWLSQDEDLRPYFEYVISSLCDNKIVWENIRPYVVLREYKNFDLCICKKNNNGSSDDEEPEKDGDPFYDDIKQAGEIVFVLENKFKSIATAAQLKEYQDKVNSYNRQIIKKRLGNAKNGTKIKFERYKVNIKKEKNAGKITSEIKSYEQYKKLDKNYNNAKEELGEFQKDPEQYLNNKICPKYVLLTLAKTFGERKAIEKDNKWIIKNYEDYAQFLSNSLLDINDEKLTTFNVSFQIIFNYIRFIRTFSLEINKHLDDISLNNNWNVIFNDKDQDFKSIRCSDIWQKMAIHKIAQELMGKDEIKKLIKNGFEIDTDSSDKHCRECLSNDNKKFSKTIFIGVQYFHSLALLEIKYKVGNDCMFVIQQQGNSLCAGIDYLNTKPEKPKEDFLSTYIVKESNITIDKNPHSYKNDKGVFFYQNIILKSPSNEDPSIKDTLDFMAKCLIND